LFRLGSATGFLIGKGRKKELGVSPGDFCDWKIRADFVVAGAKALTILAGSGTTKVVP
jgi:hypothetical protein